MAQTFKNLMEMTANNPVQAALMSAILNNGNASSPNMEFLANSAITLALNTLGLGNLAAMMNSNNNTTPQTENTLSSDFQRKTSVGSAECNGTSDNDAEDDVHLRMAQQVLDSRECAKCGRTNVSTQLRSHNNGTHYLCVPCSVNNDTPRRHDTTPTGRPKKVFLWLVFFV